MTSRFLAVLLVGAVFVAGCGDDNAASDTTTTAADESTTTLPPGTVGVQLIDVDAQTQAMTLSSASAPSGTITFQVTNTGTMEHEFLVIDTDTAAADLPYDESTDRVPEGDVTVLDEIEGIQPGETKTLELDLEAGHYALICNLVKHWRQGMRADFTAS